MLSDAVECHAVNESVTYRTSTIDAYASENRHIALC